MSQQYYRPYSSDAEDDSETDSSSISGSGSGSDSDIELPQNLFQKYLSQPSAAGSIPLNTEGIRRTLENPKLNYSYLDISGVAQEIAGGTGLGGGAGGVTLPKAKFVTNKNTTLIMINSRDRDTDVYLQPTEFYIRLPRTYKNITNIAITQLKLLSSFYYFSPAKNNTSLSILELGRVRQEVIRGQIVDVSNVITASIRQGTYDSLSLVNELNIQLNTTPLFADISGGKSSFFARFQTSGNFSELFNEPGDSTYNSLTGTYSSGLTKSDIISRYFFQVSSSGTQLYSAAEALVAYYYPMLKEMVLDTTEIGNLIINEASMISAGLGTGDSLQETGEQPFDRIVYGFRGLKDVYVTAVIQNASNQTYMDDYRLRHTFTRSLANKYTCSYDTTIGRFRIVSPSICTSINTDLTNVYSNFLVKEFTSQATTATEYATLQATVSNQSAAIGDFYNFIHQQITNSFAIDYGKFTRKFLSDSNNEMTIYDGSGTLGFATQLSANIIGNQIDTSQVLPADISGTWPLLTSTLRTISNYTSSIPVDSNSFIDISNSSEYSKGYIDLPFTINPINYAKYGFTSRCRQNMAFMTLPRTPAQRSLIDASEAYVLTSQFYDTNNTCYLDPVNVPDFYLYDISQSMFETTDSMQQNNTYLNYIKQQKPFVNQTVLPQDIVIPDYRNHIHFQVNMDSYATLVDVSNYAFDVKFNIESVTGNFPTDFKVYMYRDRAAYMYDVSNSLVTGSTIPPRIKNYFAMYQGHAGLPSLEIDLRVIGKGNYYFLLKADSTNYGTFTIRPYCILKSDYGIKYPITSDLSFRRMPYENVKSLASNPSANLYKTNLYEYDISSNYIVGYDASGVSNDYMDYLIRTNDGTGFDPYSYCSYSFKKLSTSQTTAGSNLWFYSNSSNIVTDLTTNSTYLSASNSSTFKLATGKSSTFKITNPFVANDIANPETFVMPVEQVDGRYINTDPTNSFSITNTFEGSYGYNEIYTPASGIVPVIGSPLYVCDNPFVATIDISYNPLPPYATTFTNSYSFGTDASGVTGFTIQCPYNRAIQVEQITLKFAYIDITTQRTVLQDPILTNGTSYEIQHYNNQATQLRIYRTSQILNKTDAQIRALTPLMILNRKRIFKVGTFSLPPPGQAAAPRSRNPEWGTYYTYDISGTPDPLQPYPEYYKTNGSGVQNPAPVANTYACIPFTSSGLVGAYYGLCFTRTPYTYDTTDKNLLVNYQYNNLLTKREVHPNGITSYQIQLLNSALPAVSLVSKITYSYNGVQYEPALDLTRFTPTNNVTDISGELADTQMFLYDDSKSRSVTTISNDPRYGPTRVADATKISTDDISSWGLEKGTIYKAGDNDSGYNFCSYIYNIPIRKSNSNVITIRGYVPTSRFTSGLRIIGKNWSDFGTLTLSELIQEIDDLVAGPVAMTVDSVTNTISNEYIRFSNGNYYSRNYALGLLRFNNSFKVKQTFGLGLGSASYLGEIFNGTTAINAFKAALLQYTNLYNGILANQTIVNTTSTNAITSLQSYVVNRYAGVLPSSFLKRSRLSDPIPFQIRFKSSLIPPYSTAFDEWGLGWNLGFGKTDTSFGTQQTAETFIRIVDDYIYLRMNPEIDMNTIDITEKEYLSKSQDSFGQNQRYFSKLLLNTFGNFSQTYVQAPKIFNPILGKLDKLHFQWVDRYGVILNNNDCEFNLTLQITESVDQLDESSTLITGVNQNQPILSPPNQSNKK